MDLPSGLNFYLVCETQVALYYAFTCQYTLIEWEEEFVYSVEWLIAVESWQLGQSRKA